jgi:hypothetical protein
MLDEMTKATGGARVIDIISKFDQVRRKFLDGGFPAAADAADRARQSLISHYGVEGAGKSTTISEHARISARAVQNMKNQIADVAFPVPGTKVTIKNQVNRDLWGALDSELEGLAAKTPGVDLEHLRRLNRDMSVLLPMRDLLKERASNAEAGKLGFWDRAHQVATAVVPVGGAAAHGVKGAVVGALGGAAVHVAPALARRALVKTDLAIARLGTAARAGAIPAQLVTEAQAAGVPPGVIAALTNQARVVSQPEGATP